MEATKCTIDALVVGAGEYTTGYVHGAMSTSDKKVGVVGLVLFDLRRRGLVDRIVIVDREGTRWAGIRQHFDERIAKVYKDMDVSFDSFPEDDIQLDTEAYLKAMDTMKRGDLVIIFTPDDWHFPIALAAIKKGLHVLLAKPPVKTLAHHQELVAAAIEHDVLASVEFHKRWDPCFADAKERIKNLGDFGFFSSFMGQPKSQLHTFKHWAGKSSDISYYLNSHFIDIHCWALSGKARPVQVVGMAATGMASTIVSAQECEDTITLSVKWENYETASGEFRVKSVGHAVYTSSWILPKSDVHTQQRVYCIGHKGEVNIDQAHRGYTLTTDSDGLASVNPLYMKYTPDHRGHFAGQNGYGYQSIEAFARAVHDIKIGKSKVEDFNQELAVLSETLLVSAILEAGRRSIDANGRPINIIYDQRQPSVPVSLEAASY